MNDQRPPYQVVEHEIVEQAVDLSPRRFMKEVVHLNGDAPLAMVRKRLALGSGSAPTRGALLLLHGFGQNRRAWHLSRRSFVNHLAVEGWDVFNLDLRGHGRSRARDPTLSASLDEYIAHDVPEALRVALDLSDHRSAFLLGHSLGGMVAYAAAPALGSGVGGLVTIGAPYDFGRGNRALWQLARGVVAATEGLARGAPVPMRVVREIFRRARPLWDHPSVPLPLRAWHPESFDAESLEEYLRVAFDGATLGELAHITASGVTGRFTSRNGRLDYAAAWEASALPALIIAGAHDLLAPPASVRPAYDRGAPEGRQWKVFPLGHSDLLVGRDAPLHTWPAVAAWLDARCRKLAP